MDKMVESETREPEYNEKAIRFPEVIRGEGYLRRAAVGEPHVRKNIRTWTALQKVLDSGEHNPTHLRGYKPGLRE